MSTTKKTSPQQNRDAKKAIVMKTARKSSAPVVIAAVIVLAAAAGLALFLLPGGSSTPSPTTAAAPAAPAAKDGQITYATHLFDDGKARHFKYTDTDSDITIAYFVLKSSDGVIRAAFDACDVCWPEGKGYYQDGSAMVCRNCGRRFESVLVNEVQGGCNPAPLNRTIEGDQVVIRVEDVKQGRSYFNFSKKA